MIATIITLIVWSIIIILLGSFMVVHLTKVIKNSSNNKQISKFTAESIIKVNIGGVETYFLVDSGADINIISSEFLHKLVDNGFKDLQLFESNLEGIVTAGSNIETKVATLLNINIGDNIYNTELQVLDVPQFSSLSVDVGYEVTGVLGNSFFTKEGWSLDFNSNIIWQRK